MEKRRPFRIKPWRSGSDWVWQKSWTVESDSATDRRNLRRVRRPRTRRNENSARASRRPVLRARVISRYSLFRFSEFTSSWTAVDCVCCSSDSGDAFGAASPSAHSAFFKYISLSLSLARSLDLSLFAFFGNDFFFFRSCGC